MTGSCDYWHIPYREEGFSYCKKCKKFADKLIINFNEGLGDWMSVECGKCKKTIWVCSFKNDNRVDKLYKKQKRGNKEEDTEGMRVFIKDDKKCFICHKPTNHYDCTASIYGKIKGRYRNIMVCSKKCDEKYDKIFFKENENKMG